MKPVFVDTSAFYALLDRRDRNHQPARSFLEGAAADRRPLITSDYVVDEALTLTRIKLGHRIAVALGERLKATEWCRVMDVGLATRESAWQAFVRFDDQVFSFTDCTSFALMDELDLDEVFTFDRRDFSAAGYRAVPSPS